MALLLCSFAVLVAVYFIFFPVQKTEWIMPKELNEISGIALVNDHTLACVQDEKGFIYLYDLEESKVTKQIDFAGKGDYEGIAVNGQTAYVITGNGILYEIKDFLNQAVVDRFELDLEKGQETEALCFDNKNNRLLLAFKNEKNDDIIPAIYSFDLSTKTLNSEPVINPDLSEAPVRKKNRNIKKLWQPSDITIDHKNQKLYVIDAINQHIMQFSLDGEFIEMERTDPHVLDQPEGIAIAEDGSIYICNDANNTGKGKILKWVY
jgi:uncharacterized protein YjiK